MLDGHVVGVRFFEMVSVLFSVGFTNLTFLTDRDFRRMGIKMCFSIDRF